MPISRDGRYQSEAAADREEDANASAVPLVDDETKSRAAIVEHYKWQLLGKNDARAFDDCVAEFGYEPSTKALGEVSAAAGRIQMFRGFK